MKAQQRLEKIAKEVAEKYKDMKGILVVGLYGSVATGAATEKSDVDMFAIFSEIPSEKIRERAFADNKDVDKFYAIKGFHKLDPKNEHHRHDVIRYKGIKVSVMLYTKRRLDEKMKAIKVRGYLTQEDGRITGYLFYPKSLYDPKKLISKYRKEIQGFIRESRVLIKHFWPKIYRSVVKDQSTFYKAVENNNKIWANLQFQTYINWYLFCLFSINGLPFFPLHSKSFVKKIKTFKNKPKDCERLLGDMSVLGCWGKDLNKKLKLFKELVEKTNPLIRRRGGL